MTPAPRENALICTNRQDSSVTTAWKSLARTYPRAFYEMHGKKLRRKTKTRKENVRISNCLSHLDILLWCPSNLGNSRQSIDNSHHNSKSLFDLDLFRFCPRKKRESNKNCLFPYSTISVRHFPVDHIARTMVEEVEREEEEGIQEILSDESWPWLNVWITSGVPETKMAI